jgi:hypothetical protein
MAHDVGDLTFHVELADAVGIMFAAILITRNRRRNGKEWLSKEEKTKEPTTGGVHENVLRARDGLWTEINLTNVGVCCPQTSEQSRTEPRTE